MTRWSSLPNEILSNIFQRLEFNEQQECSVTCLQWKCTAQRVLYKSLPHSTDDELYDLSNALPVYQENTSYADYGQLPREFVRILDCRKLSSSFDVTQLGKIFPHLEMIEICKSQQTFYNELYRLMRNKGLLELIKIPYIRLDEPYLELILTRIEHIKILDLQNHILSDSMTNKILQKLHIFPKLTALKLYCCKDNTLDLEELFSKDLPKLQLISLTFTYNCRLALDTLLLDIDNVQPLSGVNELKVINHHLLKDGDKSLLHMTKKFPSAHKLEIILTANSAFYTHNYTPPTTICLSQFLKYIFNMRKR